MAAALCGVPPDPKTLAAFGLKNTDFDEQIEVYDTNWPAVTIFLGMQTQWRAVSFPLGLYYLGLEYTSLPVVAQAAGYPLDQHLMQDIMTLEDAGLAEKNKRT